MTSDYTDFVLGATIKYLIQVESVLVSGLDNCQRCFSENQYTFSWNWNILHNNNFAC